MPESLTTASLPSPPPRDIVYQGTHITVNRLPLERGRVTHRYEVLTREDSTCIAKIEWYAPWRCYVLVPKDGSIWEDHCLRDVVAFLEQVKRERTRRV